MAFSNELLRHGKIYFKDVDKKVIIKSYRPRKGRNGKTAAKIAENRVVFEIRTRLYKAIQK